MENLKQAAVAVDLGAESCRVSLLRWTPNGLRMQVVRRSPNRPISTHQGLAWDIENMFGELMTGLRQCADLAPEGVASIGADGWAVDYVRLDEKGRAIGNPFCYRDERTVSSMEKVHQLISPSGLYELTGGQILRFNTLYQLYADNLLGISPSLPWLNLPEFLLYRLGGRRVSEYTNATHTQLLGVHSRNWCEEIFNKTGLSLAAAPPVVQPGSDIGGLSGELARLESFKKTRLIAPACHDTASAVAGIPAASDDWAFVSSGTWSLIGTVTDRPHTSHDAMSKNYTNQGGIGSKFYFLKNVNGMWLLRQCMDRWQQQGTEWGIEELIEAAGSLPAPKHLLDVDDPDFLLPGDMPARINSQLLRNHFPTIQETPSEGPIFANLIFHSLAARYALVLEDISKITGKNFSRLYVVGGGSKNPMMHRLVEQATGLQVIRGSAESSTLGNFAIQLAAMENGPGSTGVRPEDVARWASVLAEHDKDLESSNA